MLITQIFPVYDMMFCDVLQASILEVNKDKQMNES